MVTYGHFDVRVANDIFMIRRIAYDSQTWRTWKVKLTFQTLQGNGFDYLRVKISISIYIY